MNTEELVWRGALAKSCVESFTEAQLNDLAFDLDEMISAVVDKHWAMHSLYDPIVRETFIGIVGLDTAERLMEEVREEESRA